MLLDALAARDLDPDARSAAAADLAVRLDTLVARPAGHDASRRLLTHLQRQAPAMFTFLAAESADRVDATNWRAETDIRPVVALVYRRTWGGNRTWNEARTQGIITSVLRTAVHHGQDAVGYLAERARAPDPGLAILLA